MPKATNARADAFESGRGLITGKKQAEASPRTKIESKSSSANAAPAAQLTVQEIEFGKVVHNAIEFLEKKQRTAEHEELEARQMRKCNAQITLRALVHRKGGLPPKAFLEEVTGSIRFDEVRSLLQRRCNLKAKRPQVLWLEPHGETVNLDNQIVFQRFVNTMWCKQPLVVHVRDEEMSKPEANVEPILLQEPAKLLFARYDLNGNGRVEKLELKRLLINDLKIDRYIDCSALMMERFLDGEFKLVDLDQGSEGVSLSEFTTYVTAMSRWMRSELLQFVNPKSTFSGLAAKAVEMQLLPIHPPPPVPVADGRGSVSIVETNVFGIRVEIPASMLARHPGAKIALQTLSAPNVYHLGESPGAPKSEFIFSPIVRIDFPAFENGEEPPDLGGPIAPPFETPFILTMPHCFDPADGMQSCVFLSAPHGGMTWEAPHAVSPNSSRPSSPTANFEGPMLELQEDQMRAMMPYAGLCCVFTNPTMEDLAAVRIFLFSMPELPRDESSTLRLHICLHLPDQTQEMELIQTSEWGASKCIGSTPVLKLFEGATLKFTYQAQEHVLVWMGFRVTAEFTIPKMGDKGEEPPEDDPDDREILRGAVGVEILPGKGKQSSRVRLVSKRAGIPETGYEIPFAVRLMNEVRPNAPVLSLKDRRPFDFTLEWRKPTVIDGDGDGDFAEITHYAIEITTTAPSGTYYPWTEVWCGAGHASPDFRAIVAMKEAKKSGDTATIERLQLEEGKRSGAAKDEGGADEGEEKKMNEGEEKKTKEGEEMMTKEGEEKNKTKEKKKRAKESKVAKDGATDQGVGPILSYTLPVDPALFGYLRIRCWAEEEARPSRYSNEVKLPRWQGKEKKKEQVDQSVEDVMRQYFKNLPQHITDQSAGVWYRIGNVPSRNVWGGDGIPPPPKSEKASEPAMAPVPYDVPRLPNIPGLKESGSVLASFYKEMGCDGGGGGVVFGLRIDHVLHAIVGTPTLNGENAPSRTVATLSEPLMAFCEIAYADAMLPLLDTVVELKPQWRDVNEKVRGIVRQVASLRAHYNICEQHVKEILNVLLELHQMLRGCQAEQFLAFHLSHVDYSDGVKKALKEELAASMSNALWRLSIELLKMQLEVRTSGAAVGLELPHLRPSWARCAAVSAPTSPTMPKSPMMPTSPKSIEAGRPGSGTAAGATLGNAAINVEGDQSLSDARSTRTKSASTRPKSPPQATRCVSTLEEDDKKKSPDPMTTQNLLQKNTPAQHLLQLQRAADAAQLTPAQKWQKNLESRLWFKKLEWGEVLENPFNSGSSWTDQLVDQASRAASPHVQHVPVYSNGLLRFVPVLPSSAGSLLRVAPVSPRVLVGSSSPPRRAATAPHRISPRLSDANILSRGGGGRGSVSPPHLSPVASTSSFSLRSTAGDSPGRTSPRRGRLHSSMHYRVGQHETTRYHTVWHRVVSIDKARSAARCATAPHRESPLLHDANSLSVCGGGRGSRSATPSTTAPHRESPRLSDASSLSRGGGGRGTSHKHTASYISDLLQREDWRRMGIDCRPEVGR